MTSGTEYDALGYCDKRAVMPDAIPLHPLKARITLSDKTSQNI